MLLKKRKVKEINNRSKINNINPNNSKGFNNNIKSNNVIIYYNALKKIIKKNKVFIKSPYKDNNRKPLLNFNGIAFFKVR